MLHCATVSQAREETEEAIQAGNHRYNAMLHENMNKQDGLCQRLDEAKRDQDRKAGQVKDLESQMALLQKESEQAQGRQQKSWEDERRAAQKQQEQVHRVHLNQSILVVLLPTPNVALCRRRRSGTNACKQA